MARRRERPLGCVDFQPCFAAHFERSDEASRGCLFEGAHWVAAGEQVAACVSGRFGWDFLRLQPCPKVECVYANAKHIGGDKAILRGVQPDHTDNKAVEAGNNKTDPQLSSDQNRRNDGEKTRYIIQPKHRHGAPLIFAGPPCIRHFACQRQRRFKARGGGG
jgi:hypothetical protein